MWAVCKLILKGRLVDAFQLGETYRHYWKVVLGIFVVFGAFIPTGAVVASLNGLERVFGSLFDSGDVFATSVKFFFFGLVVFAVTALCFIAGMYFTLKLRGVTVPFGRVVTVWTVSATPAILLLVLSAVFLIIPTIVTVTLGLIILGVGVMVAGYAANTANYVGLNRIAQTDKSMLVPFTLFNVLATVVTTLVVGAFAQLVY